MDIVIIGLGQTLRGDDGAGPAIVQYWQSAYPGSASLPGVKIYISELPGLNILDELTNMQAAILVDAMSGGGAPGTSRVIEFGEVESFYSDAVSAHGFGIAEALRLGNQLYADKMPGNITLIGIEIEQVKLGQPLSKAVQTAIPSAADLLENVFQKLINPVS